MMPNEMGRLPPIGISNRLDMAQAPRAVDGPPVANATHAALCSGASVIVDGSRTGIHKGAERGQMT